MASLSTQESKLFQYNFLVPCKRGKDEELKTGGEGCNSVLTVKITGEGSTLKVVSKIQSSDLVQEIQSVFIGFQNSEHRSPLDARRLADFLSNRNIYKENFAKFFLSINKGIPELTIREHLQKIKGEYTGTFTDTSNGFDFQKNWFGGDKIIIDMEHKNFGSLKKGDQEHPITSIEFVDSESKVYSFLDLNLADQNLIAEQFADHRGRKNLSVTLRHDEAQTGFVLELKSNQSDLQEGSCFSHFSERYRDPIPLSSWFAVF